MGIYPVIFKTSSKKVIYKTNSSKVIDKYATMTVDTQGADPKVMLQWSDNGGFTWSNEYWKSAGKIGEYKARVNFTRMGMSRDRVFRVTVTDPVKWVLIDARIDVEKER